MFEEEKKMGKKGNGSENSGKDLSILLFPTRYEIYRKLKEAGEPLYASEIAEKIGVDRKLISFHLSSLERHGFVTSEFGVQNKPPPTGPPKAVRYYTLTSKADTVLREFKDKLKL